MALRCWFQNFPSIALCGWVEVGCKWTGWFFIQRPEQECQMATGFHLICVLLMEPISLNLLMALNWPKCVTSAYIGECPGSSWPVASSEGPSHHESRIEGDEKTNWKCQGGSTRSPPASKLQSFIPRQRDVRFISDISRPFEKNPLRKAQFNWTLPF